MLLKEKLVIIYKNNIKFSPSFSEEFKQIIKDVSKISIPLSQKIISEFYSKLFYLKIYPKMYPIIKNISDRQVRKIVIQKYVILYFYEKNQICILNMFSQKVNYYNLIKI